jgi:hypothetical protein
VVAVQAAAEGSAAAEEVVAAVAPEAVPASVEVTAAE